MGFRESRIGEINKNRFNTKMQIVEYNSTEDIRVQFLDNFKCIVHTTYKNFKQGKVKNPYDKTKYNIGYIGVGKYTGNNKDKDNYIYDYWNSMFCRCYNNKHKERHTSYEKAEVCEEWHNFQNFARWVEENIYFIDRDKINLDKDILQKGNKIYSPDTCIFVPQKINVLFCKSNKIRGKYPVGVSYSKINKKFQSKISKRNKTTHLGFFNTSEEAFYAYKKEKERYIKEVADDYKPYIPQKLYEAMYRYEVEITD